MLFFSNVENAPLTIKIDGKDVVFNKSWFEYKTKVIHAPSNMDIVLVSEDEKTVLFLESKFFEYIRDKSKKPKISNKYLDETEFSSGIYRSDVFRDELKLTMQTEDNGKFTIKSDEKCYLEGIKQIISHSVGINNRAQGVIEDKRYPELNTYIDNASNIYLGSILFDFRTTELDSILYNYENKYKRLATLITNKNQNRFVMLENIIKYSDIVNDNPNKINE